MRLTVKRKHNRRIMADTIEQLAKLYGMEVERQEEGADKFRSRLIALKISSGHGLNCSVYLDGDTQNPECFVVPWYSVGRGHHYRLTDAFGRAAGGSVNQYHRRKCTAVLYGYDTLLECLGRAFECIQSGEAFEKGHGDDKTV